MALEKLKNLWHLHCKGETTCFGSEGVAKDRLVSGMLKHDHISSRSSLASQ
ncbi:hypothetical protein JHK87_012147 [Glycine soja]|nr:hypothetical protein JHK87_012147 [Glycine soja]